jgi:DNA-binding beta-propeller fold protein YncE
VDALGKKVLHFDEKGVLLNSFADPANLSIPVDVWVDETTEDVYVADGTYSRIVVFNQFGKAIRAIGRRGTGPGRFRAITAMTAGLDGLYVTDRLELPVQVITKNGDFKYSFGERLQTFPTSVAVDEHQLVFVSDKSDNTIRVYENGDLVATVGGGGAAPGRFRLISDLWVNGDSLYVADTNNRRVQVFKIKAPGSLGLPLGL